jgi:hypothetical protein
MSNQVAALLMIAIIWPIWLFNLWMLFAHGIVYLGLTPPRPIKISRKDQPLEFWGSAALGFSILVATAWLAAFVYSFR